MGALSPPFQFCALQLPLNCDAWREISICAFCLTVFFLPFFALDSTPVMRNPPRIEKKTEFINIEKRKNQSEERVAACERR